MHLACCVGYWGSSLLVGLLMTICVTVDPATNNLVSSTTVPCDGYLLIAETDIQNQIDGETVSLLFGATIGLLALVFVFRLLLQQLGFKG
jgi:hypothetical protein